MNIIRVEGESNSYFKRFWEIYEYSFPVSEQRTLEHQLVAFRNTDYHLDCYLDNGMIVGFIGYWEFKDYLFIEHYAMNRERRGEGYGTKIMGDFQEKSNKIIILEIDLVVDEITTRRLRFYKHLNFVENSHKHVCHTYRDGFPNEELEVLSYPVAIDGDFYNRFNSDLGNIVMKR